MNPRYAGLARPALILTSLLLTNAQIVKASDWPVVDDSYGKAALQMHLDHRQELVNVRDKVIPGGKDCEISEDILKKLTGMVDQRIEHAFGVVETQYNMKRFNVITTTDSCTSLKNASFKKFNEGGVLSYEPLFSYSSPIFISYNVTTTTSGQTMDMTGDMLFRPRQQGDTDQVILGIGESDATGKSFTTVIRKFLAGSTTTASVVELKAMNTKMVNVQYTNDESKRVNKIFTSNSPAIVMIDGKLESMQMATPESVDTELSIADMRAMKARLADMEAQQEREREQQEIAKFDAIKDKSPCAINNDNWAYSSGNCKGGKAHGLGESVDRKGLVFKGQFASGERVKGEIFQSGQMIYEGEFKNDRPHGPGVCFYQGEYEECRFYRGERIDTLYKVRKENAKLAARMEALENRPAQVITQQNSGTGSEVGDMAVDALKREGTKRAAEFIFDQLF